MNIYTSRISSSILRLQYISPWCQIFLFLADTKCKVFYTLYTHCIDRRRRKWIFKFWIQLYIYSILTAACLPLRQSIIPICICKKILLAHELLYNLNLLNYRFCPLIIQSIEPINCALYENRADFISLNCPCIFPFDLVTLNVSIAVKHFYFLWKLYILVYLYCKPLRFVNLCRKFWLCITSYKFKGMNCLHRLSTLIKYSHIFCPSAFIAARNAQWLPIVNSSSHFIWKRCHDCVIHIKHHALSQRRCRKACDLFLSFINKAIFALSPCMRSLGKNNRLFKILYQLFSCFLQIVKCAMPKWII